jgi:hypothetical protein
MMDKLAKWYFIGIAVMITMTLVGMMTQQWRQMDCKLSLGQSGRPAVEINEICK